ncbi:hypothetical protein NC652_011010 [Populus alba x Populus x berolinensis]|nr:hypothetical protein NC652_011010 [Populus alba x Populus x berolinensis]
MKKRFPNIKAITISKPTNRAHAHLELKKQKSLQRLQLTHHLTSPKIHLIYTINNCPWFFFNINNKKLGKHSN